MALSGYKKPSITTVTTVSHVISTIFSCEETNPNPNPNPSPNPERIMMVSWQYHDSVMVLSWYAQAYAESQGSSALPHAAMIVSWWYGDIMRKHEILSCKRHDSVIREITTVSWQGSWYCSDNAMTVSWQYRDVVVMLSWYCHDY